jgi:hypothetical protein
MSHPADDALSRASSTSMRREMDEYDRVIGVAEGFRARLETLLDEWDREIERLRQHDGGAGNDRT